LSNSGVTIYSWSPSYGLNNPNVANPVTRLDRDMTYIVTGKTPADCEGSDEIFVKAYKGPEIYVPTAFTPNNDGHNDLLKAIAIGMKEYHYFIIYNRWGQPVFTTKDFTKGWDGKIKGMPQSPGTYVWVAETVDFTGKTVKRNGSTILVK
jgi:gliding motility-associated-like protein